MNETGQFHVAAELWRAAFLPLGHLVVEVASGTTFFVVKVYGCAFLTWPSAQVAVNLWTYDMSASRLGWRFCIDFSQHQVVPKAYTAPLRMWMMD